MRLVTSLVAAGLIAVAVPVPSAGAADLKSGLGCAAACIREALLETHPYAVGVRVRTDTPARIAVSVSERAAPGDGGGITNQQYIDSAASAPGRTSFATHLTGLKPDRLYEFVVSARDAAGHVHRRSTTFRTRNLQSLGEGTPGSFDSGAGCAAQCIRTAQAATGGRDAEITVNTNVPTRLTVTADRDAPVPTSLGPMFVGQPDATFSTGKLRTSYTGTLAGLQPGSRYNVIVRATDANGRVAWREGTVDTDARHARVTFTAIKVTNDADKRKSNKGEIEFRVALNTQVQSHLRRSEDTIKSGKTVHLPNGAEATLDAAPQNLFIQVQGIERDWRGCFSSNQGGFGIWTPDSGQIIVQCNRYQWSTASGLFDLDTVPAEGSLPGQYGGAGMINFSVPVDEGYLRFRVDGHVDVWYG